MKKTINAILFFSLTFHAAIASNGGGNGGHPYAAEFQSHMDTMIDEMDACELWDDAELKNKLIPTKLDTEVMTTKIEIKKRGKLIDKFGNSVSALNYPKKRKIEVLQKDWEMLTGKTDNKRMLVLHEYLGIHNEAEVDHYRISQHILNLIETCRSTTSKLNNINNIREGFVRGSIISIAQNRKTKSSIILSKDEDKLHMYISEFGDVKEIKTVSIFAQASEVALKTEKVYKFKFLKKMMSSSASAYQWCFTTKDISLLPEASIPAFFIFALTPVTLPLCTIAPGTPFLTGLLGVPFEAIGSTFKYLLGKEAIAYRKFSRLTRGKYVKASDRVFNTMVKRIKEF